MKPQETIDYHLKTSWYNVFKMYSQMASHYDFSQAMGFVLINIDEKEGTTPAKLAPSMGIEATSLSRLLKNMEDKGYIYRVGNKKDRRSVHICLTELGVEKQKVSKRTIKAYNNHLINSIPKEEVEIFFKVIQQINKLTNSYNSD